MIPKRKTGDPRTRDRATTPGPPPWPGLAIVVLVASGITAVSARSPDDAASAHAPHAVAREATLAIPEGTELEVRLDRPISTESSEPGDRWSGRLTRDVEDGGRTLLKRGAEVAGVVTHAGLAELDGDPRQVLSLEPKELHVGDHRHRIDARIVRAEQGVPAGGENIALVGGAAGAGAPLGELLLDEVLLGASLGPAGSDVIAIATEDTVIELDGGSLLTVRLEEELKVAP